MATFTRETTGIEVVNQFKDEVEGKTILIMGTSDGGLGAETATSLAHGNPAHLLLLARSEAKVAPVKTKIQETNPSIKVTFVPIELDDFDSVRQAAEIINNSITKLHVLINNAGIMALPKFTTNKNNIELQFATNHLGHFLLTALIFPRIQAAGKAARIVNLTSNGHMLGPCRIDDYNFKNGAEYDAWSGYGQAKTANILFTTQLADRGYLSFAVHPGTIRTNLARHIEDVSNLADEANKAALKNTGKPFVMSEWKTVAQGVATTLVTALDPRVADRSGWYWEDSHEVVAAEYATSKDNAQRLWTLSEKLVGQKFDL